MKSNPETIDTTAHFAKLATEKATPENIDRAIEIVVNDVEMHSRNLLGFSKNLKVEVERHQIEVEDANRLLEVK